MAKLQAFAAGSCQCGRIAYEVLEPPALIYACYCTECRKFAAGVPSVSMALARKSLRIDASLLRQWERTSDSGKKNVANFCPNCTNRIYHENPDHPDMIRLKTGTLDDQSMVRPVLHIWTSGAPSWLPLPTRGIVYETQDSLDAMFSRVRDLMTEQGH